MKRSTITRIGMLLLALALPAFASAQAASEINGTVKDSTGAVLVGANVTLRSEGGTPLATVSTDARGHYRLTGVAPGSYSLFVFRDAFATATEDVRVEAAGVTKDFTLSPATFSEEVTVSFTGESAMTALKASAPARDIPLTINSYTGAFIKAIDTKQVADLYTYMNGVNRTGGGAYDATIRGFSGGEPNSLTVDGMAGMPARQNSPNVANVERIEVLKGPTSVLYGRAQPGGMLNLITKRPQATRQNELEVRGGTFFGTGPGFGDNNSYRVDADFTGPIDSGKKVLYRLVAAYDKLHTFRAPAVNEDLFIAPAFTFNLGEGSMLTIDGEYRKIDTTLDQGLVAPRNDINFIAPITTRYQEPGDTESESGWSFNGRFTKQFSSNATWNLAWRSVYHEDQRTGFENAVAQADNQRLSRRVRDQKNKRNYNYVDTYLNKDATTGSVGHHLLFGLNAGVEVRDFDRVRFGPTGFFINLYTPVYGAVFPATPTPGFHQNFHLFDYAAYAQDRLDLGSKWKAVASVRASGQKSEFKELRLANPDREKTVGAVNPMLGLVFQPDSQWSLYGSYATSYDPTNVTAVDANGENSFDPESGQQLEGGVKAELARGRVIATAAGFHIKKKNALVAVGGGVSQQIGEQRSQGFELDVQLKPVPQWQTILGYAYTDAVVVDDINPVIIGAPLVNQGKNAFNFWTRYDVTQGSLKGLGFGLGLIVRSERAGSLPAPVINTGTPVPGQPVSQDALRLPGYTRADAGVYYVRDKYELTLRVNNLFDEIYYESAFNLVLITPGAPREATLSLRFRF